MSEYCHGLDENYIVYRLRCARGDLERVTLSYGDTACRVTPIIFTPVEMELAASDEFHDYWQAVVESKYYRVYYYFTLFGVDGGWTYYYGGEFTKELVDDRSEYFKLPINHRADIARVPDWARDAWYTTYFQTASLQARSAYPVRAGVLNITGMLSAHALAARWTA